MPPLIIENHTVSGVNAVGIVRRIIEHLPTDALEGLNEIHILDRNEKINAFGAYFKEGYIELYISDLDDWPWLLRKTYFLPYLWLGLVLGPEIDHHVNRHNDSIDREKSAEANAFKYVYPSLGIFKFPFRIVGAVMRTKRSRRIFDKLQSP